MPRRPPFEMGETKKVGKEGCSFPVCFCFLCRCGCSRRRIASSAVCQYRRVTRGDHHGLCCSVAKKQQPRREGGAFHRRGHRSTSPFRLGHTARLLGPSTSIFEHLVLSRLLTFVLVVVCHSFPWSVTRRSLTGACLPRWSLYLGDSEVYNCFLWLFLLFIFFL